MRRLIGILLTFVVVAALAAAPARAADRLTAAFSLSGTTGKYVVSNPGTSDVTGWKLTFELPSGVTASDPQNATLTQNGTKVTLTPAFYINTVKAGGSTDPYSPAFTFSRSGAEPTSCRVNDANCDGSADVPPTSPNT
ncbi:cellulose binding domain-containing protein [Actinomadura sp. NAK00032]|uniref:cellulose binding domain-containing protein n=1 Tax=Actinomadura sp. NAK00032 TaxID=2742128 RepID=UPI00159275E5|nr:cellulose binding domain-containing protein [Actinomadura sp. NAK00032]QKW38274.1 cellulose binding domain-containing protein [Actinomadura sp. NAK00032]